MECPICLSPFTEPVVASDGFTYDLTCLTEAWKTSGPTPSPMTKEPLARFVTPNYFACDALKIENRTQLKARAVAFSCPISSFNETEQRFLETVRAETRELTSPRSNIFTAGALCNYIGFMRHTQRVRTLSTGAAEELYSILESAIGRVLPVGPTRLADDYNDDDGTYRDRATHASLLDGLEKRYVLVDPCEPSPLDRFHQRLTEVVTYEQEWAHRARVFESIAFRIGVTKFRHLGDRALARECKLHMIEGADVTDPTQREKLARVLARRHD